MKIPFKQSFLKNLTRGAVGSHMLKDEYEVTIEALPVDVHKDAKTRPQEVILEMVGRWSPRVVSKLENMIRDGGDYDIFRINPYKFAAKSGVEEDEVLDFFCMLLRSAFLIWTGRWSASFARMSSKAFRS